MRTIHITRQALIDAVESATQEARLFFGLSDADTEALRRVARTADKVARGNYHTSECGCPATQAGLVPPEEVFLESEDDIPESVQAFAYSFDDATRDPSSTLQPDILIVNG